MYVLSVDVCVYNILHVEVPLYVSPTRHKFAVSGVLV